MSEYVPSTGAPAHFGAYIEIDGDRGVAFRHHGSVVAGPPTGGQDGDCVTDRSGITWINNQGTWVSKTLPSTAITGALSTVADAPAKAVLISIVAALVAAGIATDTTT